VVSRQIKNEDVYSTFTKKGEKKKPWGELVQHALLSSICSTSNPSIHEPTETSSCA
jgi:hypothetical protein